MTDQELLSACLGEYGTFWGNLNGKGIKRVVTEDYALNDPNIGILGKDEIEGYADGLRQEVAKILGYIPSPGMILRRVMTHLDIEARKLEAWCEWEIPGVIIGAGFITVVVILVNGEPEARVKSEDLFYKAKIAA